MKKTHKGLMYGIVPVYLDMTEEDCPIVEPTSFIYRPLFSICDLLFETYVFLRTSVDHEYEPYFPIKVTEEL